MELPDLPALATIDMHFGGYLAALNRLHDAQEAKDSDAAFRAIFESLNWATSIEDRIRQHWEPEGEPLNWDWRQRVEGAELMAGIRFARNRVHHDWADALYLRAGGFTFPDSQTALDAHMRRGAGGRSSTCPRGTTCAATICTSVGLSTSRSSSASWPSACRWGRWFESS